jgi:hypothetical protein
VVSNSILDLGPRTEVTHLHGESSSSVPSVRMDQRHPSETVPRNMNSRSLATKLTKTLSVRAKPGDSRAQNQTCEDFSE